MSDCTEQSFLKDVSTHEIVVIRDDGVNRHIRFKSPGTSNYQFDLITWPGCLCYAGDMGCYVFSRLDDMFQFFRTDAGYQSTRYPERTLHINLGYWAEKLKAVDSSGSRGGSAEEFDAVRFKTIINEYRVEWVKDNRNTLDKEDRRELWEAVEDEILNRLDDIGEAAMTLAYDFSHEARGHYFRFDDLFEHNFTKFTYHFTWCCYALAWGIQQYDKLEVTSQHAINIPHRSSTTSATA